MAERLVRAESPVSNLNVSRTINFVSCMNSPIKETEIEIIQLEEFIGLDVKDEKVIFQHPCANPNCGNRKDLAEAPNFVCAYFGINTDKNRLRKVCPKCMKEAQDHHDTLVNFVRQGKSVCLGPRMKSSHVATTVTLEEEDRYDDFPESSEEVEIDVDIDKFIQSMMRKYRFTEQARSTAKHLEQRHSGIKARMNELEDLHNDVEKNLNKLRKELYEGHEIQYKHLDPVEIHENGTVTKITEALPTAVVPIVENDGLKHLPPPGTFTHPQLKVNQNVFALRSSLLAPWGKGRILRIKGENEFVVRFDGGGKPRIMPRKNLAYSDPSPVQLTVGARVIAQYIEDKDGKSRPALFYAGVIAEPPKYLNQYRYLVFFDDGYAQYCTHEQVLVVCHSSKDVWQDIHMNTRSFISNYLQQFPERAMVKLQKGQIVKTELNGRWLVGRVDLVDASLAHICFVSENRHEWIYRGSTRLQPLFELMANAEARKNQGATRPTHNLANIHKKKNAPYVEYTRGLEADPPPPPPPTQPAATPTTTPVVRAVARKSTCKPPSRPAVTPSTPPRVEPTDSYISAEHKGIYKQIKNEKYEEVPFEPHQCGKKCLENFPYEEDRFKDANPLSIPLLLGWSRELWKQRLGSRRIVEYRAPCGRRMRSMDEVHRYLRLTGSQLGVDLFSFDHCVHCFIEFEPEVVYSRLNDITGGKENVRVSCVNSIDRSHPEYVEYSTIRIPREGVRLNLDPNFLSCCDCTDDCQDKEKCQCCQLTIQATSSAPSGKIDHNAGYQYRRLMQHYTTGIYECNDGCSCRKTCLNRVVQRPLQLRLQAFKTEKRGWGIRCLDDIPKGGFICVYAGQLLTDQEANEDGKQTGDEYLAELDLIEVVEKGKDGYESDVDIDIDQTSSTSQASSDGDDSSSNDSESKDDEASKDSSLSSKTKSDEPSVPEKNVAGFSTVKSQSQPREKPENRVAVRKTRELYGKNEHCYVMDAKSMGNIGRYLNHCCKPNVFVQSVFVDTHDLRFPWVAFFAQVYIRAGTELTWDYNYQIDSVPGKKLYCHCGAKECKGRLL